MDLGLFLDIYIYRGVRISEYSYYPQESEILLTPGTVLKVVDQLDLGNGLVAVQMMEIPSDKEIEEALFHEVDAIEFWKKIAGDKFEIPLECFCSGIMNRMRLPIVKKLGCSNSVLHLEAYQKYWSLWFFVGGDEQTFDSYTKDHLKYVSESECFISIQRFGLLLAWFGHFGKFLNELFNAIQCKIIFDDSMTSTTSSNLLRRSSKNHSYQGTSDLWLIRCSPKRDFPFVISFVPANAEQDANPTPVNHQRIMLNPSTRQYTFQNIYTNQIVVGDSITGMVDVIKRQYKFGRGVSNIKCDLINETETKQCYIEGNFDLLSSV